MKVYKSFLTYQIEFSVGLVSSHSVGAIAAIFYDVILLCEDVFNSVAKTTHARRNIR